MAAAAGQCPGCGAPVEFGMGSSMAKVCEYCGTTVVRSDRGLENLGKMADLANVPSLIAIGDEGTLAGRPFSVLGRLQMDHGKGPWDEYYVSFDHGQAWGWLAFAQGKWFVTQHSPGIMVPPLSEMHMEKPVDLAGQPFFVIEHQTGTVVSAEGELPEAVTPGTTFEYVDLSGPNNGFATIDYGDNSGAYTVYMGYQFVEPQLEVTQLGQRTQAKVKTDSIKCPNCGGDVPKLTGDRAQRLGCPYCGAVSDIATQQVVAQQEKALSQPDIPIGSKGTFDGIEYTCVAYIRKGADYDDEHYSWEEFLLWAQPIGFRWLVKDPETGWAWILPVELAELDFSGMPDQIGWGGRVFTSRDQGSAGVEYVLGEVYWQCEVGESGVSDDFVNGSDVLSRESNEERTEVIWSYSTPLAWPVIANAFGLPVDGPGANVGGGGSAAAAGGSSGGCMTTGIIVAVIGVVLLLCLLGSCMTCAGASSGGRGGSYRGGGVYYGGK